jgi:hypothetical protein
MEKETCNDCSHNTGFGRRFSEKKIKAALLSLLSLFSVPVFAQQLQGTIRDKETEEPLNRVIVENVQRGLLTYTNASGAFTVAAGTGDSIRFSLLGYTSAAILITPAHSLRSGQYTLSRNPVAIDTVIIQPGLSPYQQDSLDRRSVYGKKVDEKPPKFQLAKRDPVYGGAGEGSMRFDAPLSSLFSKFSKKRKRLKNFQNNYRSMEDQLFVDSRYSEASVMELTGLRQDDSIRAFMLAYPMPYDFARSATALEVKMWIKYYYKEWRSKGALPKEEKE